MKLKIPNFRGNVADLFRRSAYAFVKKEDDEMSFVRRLVGSDYPRFHIYAHLENEPNSAPALILTLHLDQKKPSYEGTAAHGGEYEGPLVTTELQRIEAIAKNLTAPSLPKKIEPW